MIEMYTGCVGSGKSYHAIKTGLDHMSKKKNKVVVANFPIKIKRDYERDFWIYEDEVSVDRLVEISVTRGLIGREGSGLLIIDEAGTIFNARDWNVKPDARKQWIKFFSQIRKFGYDVIFVCQDERMLDRQIRKLCEFEVRHLKMNHYKLFKFVPFTIFCYVRKWCGLGFKGSAEFDIYLPWVGARYDTMKIFNFDEQIINLLHDHGYASDSPEDGKGCPEGGSLPASGTAGKGIFVSVRNFLVGFFLVFFH